MDEADRRINSAQFEESMPEKNPPELSPGFAKDQYADAMASLYAISLKITAAQSIPDLLLMIVEQATQLLNAAGGGFYSCNIMRQEVRCDVSYRTQRDFTGTILKYGEGVAGKVAQSGQALIISDYRNWIGRAAVYEEEKPFRSVIAVPVIWKGEISGVLDILDDETRQFTTYEVELLTLLANQAATAIENARLLDQATKERRHLTLLHNINLAVTQSLEPDQIMNQAIMLSCQALGGVTGEAFVYEAESDQLNLRAIYGGYGVSLEVGNSLLSMHPGKGATGWVARHHQTIYLPDVTQDGRWEFVPILDENIRSAIIAPLLDGNDLLGVISVLHNRPAAFTDEQVELMDTISREVSLALGNARRYQQVQRLTRTLANQQQQLESLFDHMPVGVLLLDSGFHILAANPLGREFTYLLNPQAIQDQQILEHLGKIPTQELIAQRDSPLPIEISPEDSTERIFAVQMRQADSPALPDRTCWVLTLNEVTQERTNLARIQIQERLATVGQLAAGIAHDFNNLMAAIMVYTDLMRAEPSLSASSLEKLAVIQSQVDRASSLIRQILDFSRQSAIEHSTLNLLPLIKELEKLLARLLPETIQIEFSYQPGEYWIRGNPTRVQQIFINLALNARDAMPEGGHLYLRLDKYHLSPDATPLVPDMLPGDWARIIIRDTGAGIPPEIRQRIFEPFFTTKPVGQGTGLGLAQVYGIVRQHDGAINFNSQINQGTTFTVFFPILINEAPRPTETLHLEPDQSTPGQVIMLVEDDNITRQALGTLLESQGYQVITAPDGRQALNMIEETSQLINLVVSDVVMPDMGGIALYHALSAKYPQVRMLLISGYPLGEQNAELLGNNEIRWLQKPFTILEFKRAVHNLLTAAV